MRLNEYFSDEDRQLLQARARHLAQRREDDAAGEAYSVLQILVGAETWALPLAALVAVYQTVKIVPVPCVPPFIAGVASIRGQVLPVLALAVLLRVPAPPVAAGYVVVVSDGTHSAGLLVPGVGDVVTTASILPPEAAGALSLPYCQGFLPDHSSLLNVAALLGDPALVIEDRVQQSYP
ncbi:MAG: chemotaxis protein CheW [Anaerolineae bacterium]|nr:chemotaxis protein CheW [Anaerolineae bacterium]